MSNTICFIAQGRIQSEGMESDYLMPTKKRTPSKKNARKGSGVRLEDVVPLDEIIIDAIIRHSHSGR